MTKIGNSLKIYWIVVGIVLLCSQAVADSRTVKMGIFEWDPLMSEKKGENGLLVELVVSAFNQVGYKVVIESYPFVRIIANLKEGNIDMAPAISLLEERKPFMEFSSSIYELEQGITFKKGKISYRTINDLKPYIGGILRGAFWGEELESAGIKYEETGTQQQNIRKLVADRLDFVCMPKEIAWHWLKLEGENTTQYDFATFRVERQHVAFSRKRHVSELLEDFERGLTLIKNDGTYENIITKYQ